jgi:hypothetical protein
MSLETLEERVERLLQEGNLPRPADDRILAGYGDGSACDICGKSITDHDVEYDVEDGRRSNRILRMHLHCHGVWKHASNV